MHLTLFVVSACVAFLVCGTATKDLRKDRFSIGCTGYLVGKRKECPLGTCICSGYRCRCTCSIPLGYPVCEAVGGCDADRCSVSCKYSSCKIHDNQVGCKCLPFGGCSCGRI